MPLSGTLDVDANVANVPVVDSFDTEPLQLVQAQLFQTNFEIESIYQQALLPPALHPTNPPIMSILVMRVTESEIGPITMAQVRVGCRCLISPFNYLVSAIVAEEEAATALSARWGYRCQPGAVRLTERFDRTEVVVEKDGAVVLRTLLINPRPLAPIDVWYGGNLHLANTPRGLRLLHVSPEVTVHKADRGTTEIHEFDAAAWGDDRIVPNYPIVASNAVADVTIPALKTLNVPDLPGPQGTETIA